MCLSIEMCIYNVHVLYFHIYIAWKESWLKANIMAKELGPIILSTVSGVHSLTGLRCAIIVIIQVSLLHFQKAQPMMQRLCTYCIVSGFLSLIMTYVHIVCKHIAGAMNVVADHLSRNNLSSFFSSCPQASSTPTSLPSARLKIVAIPGPDWTSVHFTELFNTMYYKHSIAPSTRELYICGIKC